MADRIKVFQAVPQIEYRVPPLLKVFQVTGQVEYQESQGGVLVSQLIAQVEHDPAEIPIRRTFPRPHPNRVLQSQPGKRVFPVVA